MSDKLKKILLSIIALAIIGITYYFLTIGTITDTSGEITIIVIDKTGTEVINEKKSYDKGVTMIDILESNYDIEVDSGFLIRIEDVEAKDRRVAFIKIWINESPAQKGILQMEFNDGDVISFIYTEIGED